MTDSPTYTLEGTPERGYLFQVQWRGISACGFDRDDPEKAKQKCMEMLLMGGAEIAKELEEVG